MAGHKIVLSQVVLRRPNGLLQAVDSQSAAAMTRWWCSSGTSEPDARRSSTGRTTLSETDKQPVMPLTVLTVECLVYGIHKIVRRYQASKTSRRFIRVCKFRVSHTIEQDWKDIGPVEVSFVSVCM